MGGDEFILVMTGIDKASALKKIDNMRKAIASVHSVSGIALQFKSSIGASMLMKPDDNLDMIIKRADEKLYKAKAAKSP